MPYSGLGIPVAVLAVRGVAARCNLEEPDRARATRGDAACVHRLALERELRFYADNVVHSREAICMSLRPTFSRTANRTPSTTWRRTPVEWGSLPRYLGQTVLALTGRRTWVGIASWTPDFHHRGACQRSLAAGWGRWGRNGWYGGRSAISALRLSHGVDLRPLLGKIVLEVALRLRCDLPGPLSSVAPASAPEGCGQ